MIRGTLCTKLYVIIFQLRWNGYKDRPFISSCPQFEGVIPASSCNGSAIGGALEAGYAALVAVEHGDPVRLEGVPHSVLGPSTTALSKYMLTLAIFTTKR